MEQKKTSNIEEEIAWVTGRLEEIRKDIDEQKYSEIEDRKVVLQSSNGVSEKITATIEQQKKAIRDSLKEYLQLAAELDKLREAEKAKLKGRGTAFINEQMKDLMSGKL